MPILRRKRLQDGTFGDLEKVFSGELESEKVDRLESENLAGMLAMVDMFETNIRLTDDNTQLMLAVTDLYEMIIGGMA